MSKKYFPEVFFHFINHKYLYFLKLFLKFGAKKTEEFKRSSLVKNEVLSKIVQENLDYQQRHSKNIDAINGNLSPSVKRSYYETTTKLYFDPDDYSVNLLLKRK